MRKLSDINWNQVYYFYEVARRLSMKKAAQAVGVSIPTVSEHIKRLEERLDVKLFNRSTRVLTLTREGRSLFHHAENMFNTGVRFLDAVSPRSIGGYAVKIGVLETISVKLPIDFIFDYLSAFYEFGTVNTLRETHGESLENKILDGELDWGVSLAPSRFSDIESRLIGHSEIVFACSQTLYKKYASKAELLSSTPMVRSSWDHKLNKLVDDHLQMHGIFVEEFFESDHREFCIGMMQKGLCVAIQSKDAVEKSSWGKNLKTFAIGSPIYLPFYALWPKGARKMIAIKKLVECLPAK